MLLQRAQTSKITFDKPYLSNSKKVIESFRCNSPTASGTAPWHPVYRYFSDADTLSIYLVKATKGRIAESDEVVAGLLVDYAADNKIVAMDIEDASIKTPAHFWDAQEVIEGKAPLHLQQEYDADQQHLIIVLVDDPSHFQYLATDDERIMVGVSNDGQWTSLKIMHPTDSISSPF